MNPNLEDELAVGSSAPSAPSARVYTMGDQILTEVEFDDQEPPIDDGASDWSDIGDNVAENDGIDDADADMTYARAPDLEAVDMAQATFREHSDCVYSCAIHPTQPNTILTGGGDDVAYLWRYGAESAPVSIKLSGHKDTVTSVGFNFDGSLCLTAAYDGIVNVWNVADGSKLRSLEGPEDVEWAEWHCKGNAIVAGSKDGTIWMWLAHNGQCVQVFAGHDGSVNCGGFSLDGKWVLSGGEDGSIRVWAPKTGQCKVAFDNLNGHEGPVTCLAGSPDGDLILSGSVDGVVKLYQISGKRVLNVFQHSGSDDATVGANAAAGVSASAAVDDDEEEDAWGDMEGDRSLAVECVGFSTSEYRWVASGGMDKSLKIWDYTTGSCRSVCRHADGVIALAWHSTRPAVVTASLDRCIRIWDARSGTLTIELTGHTNIVTNFALRSFASVLMPRTTADLPEAVRESALDMPPAPPSSTEATTDVIVSVSDDFTAKVYHMRVNELLL